MLNRDLQLATYAAGSAVRLVTELVAYPGWQVDVDRFGPSLFWYGTLWTILFVALTVTGLAKVPRWAAGSIGLFVVTTGMTALSAVAAELSSAAVAVTLLDTRESLPFVDASRPEEFFLGTGACSRRPRSP